MEQKWNSLTHKFAISARKKNGEAESESERSREREGRWEGEKDRENKKSENTAKIGKKIDFNLISLNTFSVYQTTAVNRIKTVTELVYPKMVWKQLHVFHLLDGPFSLLVICPYKIEMHTI